MSKSQFTTPETEKKVEVLLEKMTIEEKVGQMTQFGRLKDEHRQLVREGRIGSFLNVKGAMKVNEIQRIAVEESRLGIPLIIGDDVIHGYKTISPIPLAETGSWDPALVEEAAAVAAREASAAGIHWIFAPMVDIARDVRWGRIAEGGGEDTYLCAVMAGARVKGFQRNNWTGRPKVVACPKHFAGYGDAEGGRDYNSADISERNLREVYLPPFKAAVDAGAGTMMAAFNDVGGLPASANGYLLNRILKDEWSFTGFAVSDWCSIAELVQHGIAATRAEACEKAVMAGVDMDMHAGVYGEHLADLVRQGKVPARIVDEAVRRVLRVKFWLGLFDHPYADPEHERATLLCGEHLDVALEMARKSIVLLKNEHNILPLNSNIKTLAVIGPLADNRKDLLGCWAREGCIERVVTVLEGLKSKIGASTKMLYAKGCEIEDESADAIAEAVEIAKKSEVAVVVLGESAGMSGEAHSRAFLDLPGRQEELLRAVCASGTPVVVVLMNGRPLAIPWLDEHVPAILEAWHLGTQAGQAIGEVVFGDYNPGGKLPVTFPRVVGQVPFYYNHRNTGRPIAAKEYLDLPPTPLYPFGYGLSYTRFEYGNLEVSATKIRPSESLSISVDVKNIGDRQGDEVVQLYIQDVVASITRPVRELKGFQRITLRSGEKSKVAFIITVKDLCFYNYDLEFVAEPGLFKFWVGTDSVEGLEGSFEVINDTEPAIIPMVDF